MGSANDVQTLLRHEGVEADNHRVSLIELGFEEGQGGLFATPMSGDALHDWLRGEGDA